ncbi:MAG TPA: S41 family peptidase [Candidatus Paceibacterota bacterium]
MRFNSSKVILSAALASVLFFAGGFATGVVTTNEGMVPAAVQEILNSPNDAEPAGVNFVPVWRTWNILNEKFVPASTTQPLSDEKKVYGLIEGLTASLGDPYTVFFPPEESKAFKDDISGSFEGVGMEIAIKNNLIVVVAPLKGSPALLAGIKAGDTILEIDGKSTQGMSTDAAVKLIRGKGGTVVHFTVGRVGEKIALKIDVTRDTIQIPTIETGQKDGVFIISLYSFSAPSPQLFREALREFIVSGTPKLVLDLRGNPGGYLEAAVDMASWFLPTGKTIVTEDQGKNGSPVTHRSRGYDIFNPDKLKMAILVDGGSASASEILSGALQEYGIAKLVGERTFGKGSVQELVDITDKASLKVTIARWLTPQGRSISEHGLDPDIVVKRTQEDAAAGKDPQLDAAIKLLNQ